MARPGASEVLDVALAENAPPQVFEQIAERFGFEFSGGFKRIGGQRFDSAMALLRKSVGKKDKALVAIRSGASVGCGNPARITWGNKNLDRISGGGAPRGRITQVKGKPSHGKTFACMKLAAEVLRAGGVVGWVVLESFDADWARRCGVPVHYVPGEAGLTEAQAAYNAAHPEGERFVIFVGEQGNHVLQAAVNGVKFNVFDVMIVDSISVAISRTHLENKIVGDPSPGGEAGMINQFVARIQTALNAVEARVGLALQKTYACKSCGGVFGAIGDHEKCEKLDRGKPKFDEAAEFGEPPRAAVVVVNQLRAAGIGSTMPMAPEAGGGFGLAFGKSLDLNFRAALKLSTTDGVVYGIVVQVVAEKSKVGPPEREGVIEIWVEDVEGYSVAGQYNMMTDLVGRTVKFSADNEKTFPGLAFELGVIERRGAWYYLGDEKFQGLSDLQQFLADNPVVAHELRAELGRRIEGKS